MIDFEALRRRISGQPNEQGVIGATCLYPHEARLLIAGLEAAEKDAARYRWRKENSHVRIGQFKDKYRAETQNSVLTDWFDSHDEAIDAAMASQS